MSGKFSVEDILNEVKNMTGDRYVSGQSASVLSGEEIKKTPEMAFKNTEKAQEEKDDSSFKPQFQQGSFLPDDIDNNDETEADMPDFSKMSAEELFAKIEEDVNNKKSDKQENSGIVGGFTVKTEFEKSEQNKEKNVINVKNVVKNVEKETPNLQKTMVFDREEINSVIKKKQDEENLKEVFEVKESFGIVEKGEKTEPVAESVEKDEQKDIDLSSIEIKHAHTPEHLLSADEIKSGFANETPSFRFSDRVKDLTKGRKNREESKDKFADFRKPSLAVEEVPEEIPQEIPEEIPEENLKTEAETKAEAEELFKTLSEKYIQEEKEKQQPDILNNEVEAEQDEKAEVEEIPVDEQIVFEKQEPIELDKEVKSTSDNRFSRKTSRRIFERDFDYSEETAEDDDVIDDYTSIDDEEAVRYDLDVSLRKVSKRLVLTVVTFVFGFVVTVLPSLGADFLSFISPESNLTGFMIVNAIVLAAGVLINISSFIRGLGSLITFKPDADSPLSVASLFVIAQSVIAFIPEFSAVAGKLPFYTAALIFAYVLSLMGKKAMVIRIKSNFRLVATTAVKQSCFAADERMCEMLETEDFIGTPYVATSKSVLNLHNYLRNSYSEDPSDNIAKIFAPISLIAAAATLIFTYFSTKDIVSAMFYATAVAIIAAPASVILSVHSPLKKVALQFRQRDGLISGYEAVNEFSDVDCVAINAEELFPAGSVELTSLRAIGDVSIEDVILKSAALTIGAGGPLADVFDKIIDGRRKMLPEISNIVYEDGLGLTGKVDGKIVRVGNRQFIDSYGIYGLSDTDIEEKASKNGFFVIYTAVEDEVCGMFALKYKSIDPDIEDAVYNLVSNGISIAVKSNDPNITPELIERVFEVPKEYISVMEAHTAEYYDDITRPSKNGDSIIAYGGSSTVFANLLVACKKLKTKISAAVLIQAILTILGFGICMFTAVSGKGFENLSAVNVILYQFAVAVISIFIPSFIKRIK